MAKTRTLNVTAYPYAVMNGTIEVPANVPDDELDDYVREHFDKVEFGEPQLDFAGTDFDINE
jgi:hypothetical protein